MEAIVNAIAHRDYTSNGSVQVMLFKDRLEIWNPGSLPLGLSPEKLCQPHRSIPGNTGQAENETTGQDKDADNKEINKDIAGQATGQAEEEVAETVKRVVLVIEDDLKRAEIQEILGLKDRETFVLNYLNPSLEAAYIEMTIPEIPTHKEQRYRLTAKGAALKKQLLKNRKKK